MGCDVHIYRERMDENGKWKEMDTFTKEDDEDYPDYISSDALGQLREYCLFGILAEGVRYDTDQAFIVKGIPEDVSKPIDELVQQWCSDGHSHSYLNIKEVFEKVKHLRSYALIGELSPYYMDIADSLEKVIKNRFTPDEISNPEKHRIVFWFDN